MPAYQTAGTYGQTAGGNPATSIGCGVPSGVVADDVVVLHLYTDPTTSTITPPAGFAEAVDSPTSFTGSFSQRMSIYWKRAVGSESGTYTTTFSASTFAEAVAIRYSGCITTGDPFDVTAAAIDSVGNTLTPAVSVTTSVDNTLLVHSGANWSGGAWTPSSGFTTRATGGFLLLLVATKDQAATGSSGTVQATNASNAATSAWLGALKGPATAGTSIVQVAARPGPTWRRYFHHQAMWQQSQAPADITPTPTEAVGSGTADPASIAAAVAATEAAGSGAAVDGQAGATTTASESTGSGTAFDATASFAGTVNPTEAAGTGTAFAAATAATVTAAEATGSGVAHFDAGSAISLELTADDAVYGTGVAYDAVASTSSAGTVNPTEAAGSGVAQAATTAAAVNAAEAVGSGTAFNPSVSGSLNVTPAEAVGSGTADPAAASAAVAAGVATGSGTADPAATGNGPVPAEASGSGAAPAAVPAATVAATEAAGTGSAFDATAVAGGPGNVAAGVASGSGFAYDALTRKLIIRPFSGVTSRPVGSPAVTLRP